MKKITIQGIDCHEMFSKEEIKWINDVIISFTDKIWLQLV